MPTGDRGVDIYHMIKSAEGWCGFILEIPSSDTIVDVQKSLDNVLVQNKHQKVKVDGNRIYLKGNYGGAIIAQLKGVIDCHMDAYTGRPMHITGSYFNFLSDYWVKEAIERFRTMGENVSSQNT